MKLKTVLKIGFCVLLVGAVTFAALGLRLGANHLHAKFVTIRNDDFFADAVLDIYENGAGEEAFCEPFEMEVTDFRATILSQYDGFYGERLTLHVQNDNPFDINILGLEVVSGEGKDAKTRRSVFFSRIPERIVTVPANTAEPVPVWFDIITDYNIDLKELLTTIQDKCSVKVLYVDASTGITTLADATDDVLQKEWIRK